MNELSLPSAESTTLNTPVKRRRRGGTRIRTGCDTCKARHTRCDEGKPVCGNCQRLNLRCRQPDFIVHYSYGPAEEPRQATRDAPSPASDQQTHHPEQRDSATSPALLVSTWDLFKTLPPSATEAAGPASPIASAAAPLTSEMVYLLQRYQTGVATWMDMFDHACTYQREVSRRCTTSALLVNSVCAFTAKNLSLLPSGAVWAEPASRYYSKALRMLIRCISDDATTATATAVTAPARHCRRKEEEEEDALTATILLSSYEMIASQEAEHKQHFHGAALLITGRGVSAASSGVDGANFWIYVRHEIFVALVNEAPLRMAPEEWKVAWREGETDEHMLGNQALWLVGRAINVLYRKQETPGVWRDTQRDILADAARWNQGLPASFHGIKYGEADDQGFCKIYFALPAAAASMLLFHLLHILLLAEATGQDSTHAPQIQHHATEIAILGASDLCQCVRNFSVQALFFAAKHITGISKKLRIWNMLVDIEVRLGFSTRNRIKRLEQLLDTRADTRA